MGFEDSVAHACQCEHQALQNIKEALRVTLDWKVPADGLSRKLSSVLFIIRALQRHLEHQLELEEQDGYMSMIGEQKPAMTGKAQQLRHEHDIFRKTLDDLLPMIERLTPNDEAYFERLCHEVVTLLQRIERHDEMEADLLQEALLTDEGGEG